MPKIRVVQLFRVVRGRVRGAGERILRLCFLRCAGTSKHLGASFPPVRAVVGTLGLGLSSTRPRSAWIPYLSICSMSKLMLRDDAAPLLCTTRLLNKCFVYPTPRIFNG